MKKILIVITTTTALIGAPALAADLPMKAPIAAPAFNWSGFYLGGEVGYGFDPTKGTLANAAGFGPIPYKIDPSGALGGVRAGFNWQAPGSPWVAGIEANYDWASLKDSGNFPLGVILYHIGAKIQDFLLVRGRLGYAIDRTLFFVTGGFASAHSDHNYATPPGAPPFLTMHFNQSGWTGGIGFEYALLNNWTVTAEYRYVDLGRKQFVSTATNSSDNFTVTTSAVLIGANYKFGH
jgi:opacity protein-like surface antigen